MFIRNVARTFKKKKSAPKTVQCEAPTETKAIYYQEPAANSVESSEVEYIEDDDDHGKDGPVGVKPTPEPKKPIAAPKPIHPKVQTMEDTLLSLSVVIPSGKLDLDDDSSYSQEGILTKLPPYLVEKKGYHGSLKIESRPSMTTSTTSEEHGTQVTASMSEQTVSESGSTAGSSSHHDMNIKEKKILASWKVKFEGNTAERDTEDQRTASFLLELGSLHMQCEQYEEAKIYFTRALAISEAIYDNSDLRIARALELYGMVESARVTSKEDLSGLVSALSSLDRAFRIRYQELGPTHIDTVETLNKIARVQMKQRVYTDARDSYYEVLKLREAIFGRKHPCVAVTAQALATAHTKLFDVKEAKFYFHLALNVYEMNGLQRHCLADAIRRDLNDLKFIKTRYEI